MTDFRCVPIDTPTARRFRATGRDDGGNAIRRTTAVAGQAYPCRHCLALAAPGEDVLLGSWHLPKPQGLYWTPSPIFLHAADCPRFEAENEIAPIVRANPLVSVRAYDAEPSVPLRSRAGLRRGGCGRAPSTRARRRTHRLRQHPYGPAGMPSRARRALLTRTGRGWSKGVDEPALSARHRPALRGPPVAQPRRPQGPARSIRSSCITPTCRRPRRRSPCSCDPATEVSSHYLVDEDGGLIQLVPEARRAWHAGRSFWQRRAGHEFGVDRYRDRQCRPTGRAAGLPGRADRGRCRAVPGYRRPAWRARRPDPRPFRHRAGSQGRSRPAIPLAHGWPKAGLGSGRRRFQVDPGVILASGATGCRVAALQETLAALGLRRARHRNVR